MPHTSPAVVLAGLDVVGVRHLPVEEGIADGAGRVTGREDDDAFALDHSCVVPTAVAYAGLSGSLPLDFESRALFAVSPVLAEQSFQSATRC